jgi:hypothetical protein
MRSRTRIPFGSANSTFHWMVYDQASLQSYALNRLNKHPEEVASLLNAILGLSEKEDSDFLPISDPQAEPALIADIISQILLETIEHVCGGTETDQLPRTIRRFLGTYRKPGEDSGVRDRSE